MAITLLGSAVFEAIAQAAPGPVVPYTSAGGTTLIAVIIDSSPQALGGIASITDSAGNIWQCSTSGSQKPPSATASGGVVDGVTLFGNWAVTVAWCINAAAITSVTVKDATGWSAAATATGTTTQFIVPTSAAAAIKVNDIFSDLGPGQVLPADYTVTGFGTPSGGNTPVNFTPAAPSPIASGDTLSSGLNCWYVSVTEWSGIATAGSGVAVTGTGSPAPSLTLVSASDLVIGAACYSITEPPAGWSLLLPSLPLAGYTVPGAAGTYSPSWTAPGTQPSAAAVMSFRESRVTYEATVLADNPSFLWLLNELSGSTAADATGNGNTGTYSNNASPTTTHVPPFQSVATDFTGSQQSVDATGTLTAFQETSAECWFNTTAATGGAILQYGHANFVVYMHNDGTMTFGVWTGSQVVAAGPTATAYNDGKWHYAAVTFSGSGTHMYLYVDGVQVASATASAYAAGNSTWYVAEGYNVTSSWPGTQTNNNLLAYFAAAATYPAVLSPAQISAHYAAGIGGGGTKYLTGSAVPALISSAM